MTSSPALPIATRAAALLRDNGPATVNDISRVLELSRTSVENAMGTLSEAGLVLDIPARSGRGAGRPARLYRFDASHGTTVGVDIGAASIRVVASDLSGTITAQRAFAGLDESQGASAKLAAVTSAIRSTLSERGIPVSAVRAIGVSLPGIVDDNGHVIASVVIPEWSGVDIGAQLRQAFSCPVALDNGVRNAAIAEHHLGAAQLVDDFVYLSVGHRIAMGLMLGGRPRRGTHNIAGDIGRLAFRGLDTETGQIAWKSAATAEEVFRMAREGDTTAETEIHSFVDEVAHGIAMVVMTIDPAMVVIGGGLSRAHDQFLVPLRSAVSRHIRLPIQIPIVEARLGVDAGAHGALIHAFRRFSGEVYRLENMPIPQIKPLELAEA